VVVTRLAPHVHRGLSCPPARWCAAAKISSETAVSNSFLLSGRGDARPPSVHLGPLGCVFTRTGGHRSDACGHIDGVVDGKEVKNARIGVFGCGPNDVLKRRLPSNNEY
jgi:hypothetical protein